MTTIDAKALYLRAPALEFAVSFAVALPFLAAATTTPSPALWCAVAISLGLAARAVVHDIEHGTIPTRFVVPAALPPAAIAVADALGGRVNTVLDVVVGATAMGGPLLVLHTVSPRWFGFGDVALGCSLGLVLGLVQPASAFTALLLASVLALAGAWQRRATVVAFAPSMLAGAALVCWLHAVLGS